uniref:RING-type domain-containing protein n=1 Tax=Trichuris muris TaxID=70415 RepID=A0A5S6QHF4_TRIMR
MSWPPTAVDSRSVNTARAAPHRSELNRSLVRRSPRILPSSIQQPLSMRSQEGRVTILLQELIPLLLCRICNGFLVDAVSLLDCNHSFCRSCFLDYIKKKENCPVCGNFLNKNKLETCFKNDGMLQMMVYKCIPALQMAEERDRKTVYEKLQIATGRLHACLQRLKSEGQVVDANDLLPLTDKLFGLTFQLCAPNDPISIGFEFPVPDGYFKNGAGMKAHNVHVESMLRTPEGMVRSTRCFFTTYAMGKVATLKKMLMDKYSVLPPSDIEIVYGGEILREDYSLSDVLQIFLGGVKRYLHFYFQAVTPCDLESLMPQLMPEMIPEKKARIEEPQKEADKNVFPASRRSSRISRQLV